MQFLKNLTRLDVSRNIIGTLSAVSMRLHHDHTFAKLEFLDFSSNKIAVVQPIEVKQFEHKMLKFKVLNELNF